MILFKKRSTQHVEIIQNATPASWHALALKLGCRPPGVRRWPQVYIIHTPSVCEYCLRTRLVPYLPAYTYLPACLPAWFSHEYDVCTMICCGYPVWRRSSFLNTNNIYIYIDIYIYIHTYRYPVQSLVVMCWHALHSLLLDSADFSSSGSVCRQWYRTFRSQIATRWHLKAGLLGVECLPWWEPWFNMVQELNFCRCVRPWSIRECTSNHRNVKRWTSSSGCSHRRLHPLIRFWAPTYRGQKVWKWPCFCLARQLTLDTQPRVCKLMYENLYVYDHMIIYDICMVMHQFLMQTPTQIHSFRMQNFAVGFAIWLQKSPAPSSSTTTPTARSDRR